MERNDSWVSIELDVLNAMFLIEGGLPNLADHLLTSYQDRPIHVQGPQG